MLKESIEYRRKVKPQHIDCRWCHERPGCHSIVSFLPLFLTSKNNTNAWAKSISFHVAIIAPFYCHRSVNTYLWQLNVPSIELT